MLFMKVARILKVLFGWVGRDWNGFYHVLQIFEIGFQVKIMCANTLELIISFSNSGEG